MLPRFSRFVPCLLALVSVCMSAAPLRVLVVSDDPAATALLVAPLQQSGAKVTAANQVSSAALKDVDAVLLHGSKFVPMAAEGQKALADFARHGGGIVAVRGAVAAGNADWGKSVLGGAWTADSQKFRNKMLLAVRTDAPPIE